MRKMENLTNLENEKIIETLDFIDGLHHMLSDSLEACNLDRLELASLGKQILGAGALLCSIAEKNFFKEV